MVCTQTKESNSFDTDKIGLAKCLMKNAKTFPYGVFFMLLGTYENHMGVPELIEVGTKIGRSFWGSWKDENSSST